MAFLGQDDVADALVADEVLDLVGFAPGIADVLDVLAFRRIQIDVVVGDHDQLVHVPDGHAQFIQLFPGCARSRRIMDHGQVDIAGHNIARLHRFLARGAGEDLFTYRLAQGGILPMAFLLKAMPPFCR